MRKPKEGAQHIEAQTTLTIFHYHNSLSNSSRQKDSRELSFLRDWCLGNNSSEH